MLSRRAAIAREWSEEFTRHLICPNCRSRMGMSRADCFACAGCHADFPIEDGILRCVTRDEFYEGTYDGELKFIDDGSALSRLKLYLINTHYLARIAKYVNRGARLLELGSGGGSRFLARHGRTTAVDLSFGSLQNLDPAYEAGVQADALRLPFSDASYDAIVSAYFYEHIPVAHKSRLLQELRRVLRPHGRIVLLFDTKSSNPLFNWLRRDEQLFSQCIVENDHHYGLESPTDNLARFRESGLEVIAVHCANKTPVQHLPVYEWIRPYGGAAKMAANVASAVSRNSVLQPIYTSALTLFDDIVEPVLPIDWARIMLVVLEMP